MDLFIIEAPLKCRSLEVLLTKLGFSVKVQATKGHLFQMPETLEPVSIDSRFREFERKPRDLTIVERIRSEVRLAERVIIATDADAEGDVIAWDVATCIHDLCPDPLRVRLKGMDHDSVKEAINAATPVNKADAVAGRTRAILDRLIGAGFTKKDVAVGRVSTALLGLVASQKPSVYKLRLVAPAKDRGRPWVAETACVAPIDVTIARRLAATDLPTLDFAATQTTSPPPGHMGDIMVRASDKLDMSPMETNDAMQRLYEGGRMSYPRAGSRGMSRGTAAKIAEVLRKAGYGVETNNFAEKPPEASHDAPYPIGKVDLSSQPGQLGNDEGVRALVARDLVKSGQKYRIETAQTEPLVAFLVQSGYSPDVARAVAKLEWRRELGPRYPGQESWPSSGLERRRPDAVLLEHAIAAGLGRPSTWAKHIERFVARGLVDDSLGLTEKGRAWIQRSPQELLDPRVSAAIELACERPRPSAFADPTREPWEVNAERIVAALPPTLREVATGLVAGQAPRPLVDPVEAYGLDRSAIGDVEAMGQSPVYAPSEN